MANNILALQNVDSDRFHASPCAETTEKMSRGYSASRAHTASKIAKFTVDLSEARGISEMIAYLQGAKRHAPS